MQSGSLGESGHPLLATGNTGVLHVLDGDNLGGYNSSGDGDLLGIRALSD